MTKLLLSTNFGKFRFIALMEGYSYLLLLGIAMPIKYIAGNPYAVKYMGWAHGILFIFYCAYLILVWKQLAWHWTKAALAFIASLLPFGAFYMEKKFKLEDTV